MSQVFLSLSLGSTSPSASWARGSSPSSAANALPAGIGGWFLIHIAPETPLSRSSAPLRRERNPGGRGQGEGRWWGHSATLPLQIPPFPGGHGSGEFWGPASYESPLYEFTIRSLASGSPSFYPTQPSPAAIEDLLTPVQVVPGLDPPPPLPARLPGIPTPHLPRASGKLPAPGVSLGESPSRHPSRLPCEPVCPTSSSADLPSTGRRNTEALFTRTGPCLGAWPRAQVGGREQNSAKEGRGALCRQASLLGQARMPLCPLQDGMGASGPQTTTASTMMPQQGSMA